MAGRGRNRRHDGDHDNDHDNDRDDWGDEFDPEPEDRADVGRVRDPDRDEDVELLDETWQHSRAGGARWLLLLLVIPVVALVVLQLKPDTSPSATPAPSPSAGPTSSPDQTRSYLTSEPEQTETGGGEGRGTKGGAGAGDRIVKKLSHPVLGVTAGWELFIRGDDEVTRVQLAAGKVTTTPVPSLGDQSPVSFVATPAGALAVPQGFGTGYVVPDGHTAKKLPANDIGSGEPLYGVLPGPDPQHLWAVEASGNSDSELVLLDLGLRPVGTKISIPGNALMRGFGGAMSDGFGTPIARTPGGTYALSGDGARRITTGVVLGAGPTRWVVDECDASNHCTLYVIDRETGTRRLLPGQPPPDPIQGYLLGLVSPDGAQMVSVVFADRGPSLSLTDLHTGTRRNLGQIGTESLYGEGMTAWSPDGRWLFFPKDSGGVGVYDARSGKVTDLGLDLSGVQQIAVRPAS